MTYGILDCKICVYDPNQRKRELIVEFYDPLWFRIIFDGSILKYNKAVLQNSLTLVCGRMARAGSQKCRVKIY
jgi:hypothetical protein